MPAVVLPVPFGLRFAVGVGPLAVAGPLGTGLLVVAGVPFALAIAAVAALVRMPVQAYLRYYALLGLGDVDATPNLIPDRRAAVRDAEPG